jgi:hypothetical protein
MGSKLPTVSAAFEAPKLRQKVLNPDSKGSQLVYVELASGARFLFVGDIAWSLDNIREQIGRPGFARLLIGEDRGAVAAQVQALGHLPQDVHVIVAHPVALENDLKAGLYRQGFSGL